MKTLFFVFLMLLSSLTFGQQPGKQDTTKLLPGWWVDDSTTLVFHNNGGMLTIYDTTAQADGETFGSKWKFESGILIIETPQTKGPKRWKPTEYRILELSDSYLSFVPLNNVRNLPPYKGKRRRLN